MQIDLSRRIRGRLPELVGVAARFPLAVIAALALAGYHVLDLHLVAEWPADVRIVRVPVALGCAFVWSLIATLIGEARGLDAAARLALGAAGWFVIALIFVAARAIELTPAVLLGGLVLTLAIAPYVQRGVRNAELWQFNHTLWAGLLVSVIAMVLSAGGISAIIETMRYLFGLDVPRRMHEKVWVVAGLFIAPVYWLSLVPRAFDAAVVVGAPQDFTSRAIAVLVRFILVPILLAYAAILHVYAVTIGFAQALPKGRIGWLVLCYGAAMAATALAAYPTRNEGGTLVRVYGRIWPWLLPVPVLLLGLAVFARINQYGLTEHRYLVVLGAVWLASLVVTQGLFGRRADLRFIPAPLAIILLLASLGPWGIAGWPVRDQVRLFEGHLQATGVLKDGRLGSPLAPTPALRADRQRLADIIDYLNRHARLGALQPLFRGDAKDPFAGLRPADVARFDIALADRVRERLGLGRTFAGMAERGGGGRRIVSYVGASPAVLPVTGAVSVIGPVTLHAPGGSRPPLPGLVTADGPVKLALDANVLTVSGSSGPLAAFDLGRLWGDGGPIPKETDLKVLPAPPLHVERTAGLRAATLIVTSINGSMDESGAVEVRYVNFWLLLASGP